MWGSHKRKGSYPRVRGPLGDSSDVLWEFEKSLELVAIVWVVEQLTDSQS